MSVLLPSTAPKGIGAAQRLNAVIQLELAGQLRSSIVIPMHWFSYGSLDRFLVGMESGFGIVRETGESIDVALDTLPASPQVRVLTPR